jgi:hypothetical protein
MQQKNWRCTAKSVKSGLEGAITNLSFSPLWFWSEKEAGGWIPYERQQYTPPLSLGTVSEIVIYGREGEGGIKGKMGLENFAIFISLSSLSLSSILSLSLQSPCPLLCPYFYPLPQFIFISLLFSNLFSWPVLLC